MKQWFSSKLRFAVLIDSVGLDGYVDSIITFQADDFDSAFLRALGLGCEREQSYTNGSGQLVAWRLAEIMTLDVIQAESLNGAEVYSEPVAAKDPTLSISAEYHPENSTPTQTF